MTRLKNCLLSQLIVSLTFIASLTAYPCPFDLTPPKGTKILEITITYGTPEQQEQIETSPSENVFTLSDTPFTTKLELVCSKELDSLLTFKRIGIECSKRPAIKWMRLHNDGVSFEGFNLFGVGQEAWEQLHTIELFNLDYEIVNKLLPIMDKTYQLRISNDLEKTRLSKPLVLSLEYCENLTFFQVSYDPYLFVESYEPITNNNALDFEKRKVISGPMFSGAHGHTFIPAKAHPLLFDNSGTTTSLEERTKIIFSTLPSIEGYVEVEIKGSNHVTAIDFTDLPLTPGILDSLFQSRLEIFDPVDSWQARIAWGNKFLDIEWLDLSKTMLNDLAPIQNLKKLKYLKLHDVVFLNLQEIRALQNLKEIDWTSHPLKVGDRASSLIDFVGLSLSNWLKLKHDFSVIVVWLFGVAVGVMFSFLDGYFENYTGGVCSPFSCA